MTARRVFLFLLATAISLALLGCDLSGPNDGSGRTVTTAAVYVGNQGNFGDGNGSVTVFTPESGEVQSTAVSGLNSIVQSIAVQDTSLYVMANSAARVDVFSTRSLTQTAQLTDLSGPRYLAFVGSNTAYVTDQSFGGPSAVHVLDLSDSEPQIESSISVSGLPEAVATTENRLFASLGAFGDTTLVAAINTIENTLIEEIEVGCPSRYLASDSDADVFVFCSNAAEAVIIDGFSGQVQNRLSLPDTAATAFNVGQTAFFAPGTRELYVATNTEILRIDTQSNTVATTLDVENASSIGAVAYDGVRRELYVARVRGFTERGLVTRHDRDGTQLGSFEAGIAPTHIDFRQTVE